jgi:hypothetical protein
MLSGSHELSSPVRPWNRNGAHVFWVADFLRSLGNMGANRKSADFHRCSKLQLYPARPERPSYAAVNGRGVRLSYGDTNALTTDVTRAVTTAMEDAERSARGVMLCGGEKFFLQRRRS